MYARLICYIVLLKTLVCYMTQTLANLQETVMFGYYIDVLSNFEIEIIETAPNMDIPMCVNSCKHSDMCNYINFKRNVGFCYHLGLMTSQDSGVAVTRMPGYVYGNKSEWHLTNNGVHQKTGCGIPPTVDMTEAHGNMFTIGSHIQYVCVNNRSKTDYSVCDSTGAWSNTSLVCISECDPAPDVPYTLKGGNSQQIGSQVTYTCDTPKQASGTITCQHNGTWTELADLKCIPDICLNTGSIQVYGDSCYMYISSKYTWSGAKTSCENLGGYLAKITDQTEMNNIKAYVQSLPNYNVGDDSRRMYIGLNDLEYEGNYKWLDGDDVTYHNWHGSEPNGGNIEHCVMFTSWDLYWYDMRCGRYLGSLCEFDLV